MASVAVALWMAAPAHAVETAVIVLDDVDLDVSPSGAQSD